MVKLKSFEIDKNILSMDVLIEGDEKQAYRLSVDLNTEMLSTVFSSIPENEKMYEVHARMALRNYKGKKLPETITGVWY